MNDVFILCISVFQELVCFRLLYCFEEIIEIDNCCSLLLSNRRVFLHELRDYLSPYQLSDFLVSSSLIDKSFQLLDIGFIHSHILINFVWC